MSTIGTTLKEPRVFAHDAIALNDLTYPPTPAVTFTVVEAGTDYTAATVYDTMSQDGGREANINVVAIGVGGTVTSVDLAGGDGGYNYAVGDLITLTGQGSNNNCIVEVDSGGNSIFGNDCINRPTPPTGNGDGEEIPGYDVFLLVIMITAITAFIFRKRRKKFTF